MYWTPSPLAELEFCEDEPVPEGAAADVLGVPMVAADDSSEETDAGVEMDEATGAAEDALVIIVVAAEVIAELTIEVAGVIGVALRSAVKVESSAELVMLLAARSILDVAMAEVVTPPDPVAPPDPPPSATPSGRHCE